jgi:hypothetical protein
VPSPPKPHGLAKKGKKVKERNPRLDLSYPRAYTKRRVVPLPPLGVQATNKQKKRQDVPKMMKKQELG